MESIEGKKVNLCDYSGKVIVAVNTASECGFTPQYKGLEELYEKYKDKGLVVLGFPSNDFGGQEPAANDEVKTFCERRYGVTFPLFSKTSVVKPNEQNLTGKVANFFLKKKSDETDEYNEFFGALVEKTNTAPQWNFTKYVIDRTGNTVRHFGSSTKPMSKDFVAYIESLF